MKTIKYSDLQKLIYDSLVAAGLEDEQAQITTDHMAYADIHGTDTHGIMRLPIYVKRLTANVINKKPNYQILNETSNSLNIDADNGMGHYFTDMAMKKAIEKAKENTIGFVTVKNGNHFGALAPYSRLAAEENMIGFITTNAAPLMAPPGGAERMIGNNPVSFAVPRKDKSPLILDMALSKVAGGKLVLASKKGEDIPLGWALDNQGKPTTDPYEGFENNGILLPIGGHKGYGLSLVMDILAGVLSGAKYGKSVNRLYDTTQPLGSGHAVLVLNINNLMNLEEFYERLEDYFTEILSAKTTEDGKIMIPGDIEAETAKTRESEGIPLPDKLWDELEEMLEDLNLSKSNYGF
ncbi:Ldh family oxidoreductase [Sporosarcina cascadiensis]|uniref:Ldh family oxidoreductase n=1 Tax=Sporosarcina cascadiensis TaxID=2660747 RepID=UPI00129B617A|nr:Ldh family oxidoreductase [Sporosarcina cascadiensis]